MVCVREEVEPEPGFSGARKLAVQGVREEGRDRWMARGVPLVDAQSFQVVMQVRDEAPGSMVLRSLSPFSLANHHLTLGKVDVLDPQAETFDQPQALP